MGRITRNKLYQLRNLIPVDMLIKDHLYLPCKMSEGYFRFLCPVCNEFQTAVNPKTNLSRCFSYEKNFNTIDLLMIVKGLGFVESVRYLQKLLPDIPPEPMAQRLRLTEMLADIGKSME